MAALRELQERFWTRTMRGRPVCAGCGSRKFLQAHHAIPQQLIARHLAAQPQEQLEAALWDPRNGVPLCSEPSPRRCHERHTLAVVRLPRRILNPLVWEFAVELDRLVDGEPFTVYLETAYR